jgi:hypothetical protein
LNPLGKPDTIPPVESKFDNGATDFSYTFSAASLTVLHIDTQ